MIQLIYVQCKKSSFFLPMNGSGKKIEESSTLKLVLEHFFVQLYQFRYHLETFFIVLNCYKVCY